ncbi:hypothetical protein PHLGIDRAFT_122172 [Phlebiopsis gigantea 11061_1 CR5-6]|uniref:F-box domain-containing protein n=1 Tax=Phlebiopsis gigantea (strain 11061_1 CR5-6) TaxID=745531 RepID=A0A0C3S443_PHLG1|nr:hypothetical protein PHLGIDRAFT_122172 [Phlebiopsis gigantea 11061_1 CR5-6]
MVSFPPEIVDMFLSHLPLSCASAQNPAREVKSTLQSCSLVCRVWRPLATSRLFRELKVVFSYSPLSLDAAVAHQHNDSQADALTSASRGVPSLDDFFKFLSSHDHVRHYIRRLVLRGFSLYKTERYVQPELLIAVVNLLPRLVCLELLNIGVNSPGHKPSVHVWPAVERTLPQLTVKYDRHDRHRKPSDVHNPSDVFRLLACFGNVDTLYISPPTRRSAKLAASGIGLARHLRTRHLSIDTSGIGFKHQRALQQFLSGMNTSTSVLEGLRSLSLVNTIHCEILRQPGMISALTAVCATLEVYTATITFQGHIIHPDLSACTALRSLTLDLLIEKFADGIRATLDTAAADLQALGLAHATHPAFRALTLILRVPSDAFILLEEFDPGYLARTAACARAGPSQGCAAVLAANRLDGALVRLAGACRLAEVRIRLEVRSGVEVGDEAMCAFLGCVFPGTERTRLAVFEAAAVGIL